MTCKHFTSKAAFIAETDGLLKHYVDAFVIKKIKAGMTDEPFKHVNVNHVHAAVILKNISPCALKTFAASMRMSKAAASALIDRMVKAGIVSRKPNPLNRREVLLSVSPEFEAHVGFMRLEMTKWFEKLADKIGMDNFEKWHEVMLALNKVLQEEIQTDLADGKTNETS